ncbi:ESPR-type extended signal peptide-containing protein [Taylorella equigenitalis]|uniref:ESPR-type extended signal peptide-containing protein n=1 Tax=Taylorella equigenitalis TaxID=29575 RepID=UPI00237EB6C7|nr:YadA-like family protein [Taylorella equigenitalis]WDU52167.1 YadA-like family protein [Taylorella equigenitalis]
MNKIYKSIYNEVLGTWVAISEVAKAGGKKSKSKMLSSVVLGMVLGTAGVAGEAWGESQNPNQVNEGVGNTLSNDDEISVLGYKNNVTGRSSIASGTFNYTKGGNTIATGYKNIVKNEYSLAYGNNNILLSNKSVAIGKLNFTGDITKLESSLSEAVNIGNDIKYDTLRTYSSSLISKYSLSFNLSKDNSVEMLALGHNNFALNTGAIAFGNKTLSTGVGSIALGNVSVALLNNDIAIGTKANSGYSYDFFENVRIASRPKLDGNQITAVIDQAQAKGDKTGPSSQIAIGDETAAMGRQVLAVGSTNRAFGTNSTAVGKGNFAHGDAAQTFGNWNIAMGNNTVAIGNRNDSTGFKSLSTGFENRAYGDQSTAVGYLNRAELSQSVALGHTNIVYANNSIALGTANVSGWKNGVSLPSYGEIFITKNSSRFLGADDFKSIETTNNNYKNIVAVGSQNGAFGANSSSLGVGNFTLGLNSVAVGNSNFSKGDSSMALGLRNTAKSLQSTTIGFKNIIDENSANSSAIGQLNFVSASNSHAHGEDNSINSAYSSAFGIHNEITLSSDYSNTIGYGNNVSGLNSTILGNLNTVSSTSSLAFGTGNEVSGLNSISIGSSSTTGIPNSTIVIKKSIVSGEYAISIGHNNKINSNKSVAFGNHIDSNGVANSVILGNESKGIDAVVMSNDSVVEFGGLTQPLILSQGWTGLSSIDNGSVSVGDKNKERQLKHVATGAVTATSTDAINGSQLFAVIQAIGNTPLGFKADNASIKLDRKLGHTISFLGGAEVEKLSENNIGVNVNGENIEVKLTNEIKGLVSIESVEGSKFSDNGFEVKNGPSLTKSGIDANNKKILNVQKGIEEDDVANVGNVNDAITALKKQGYTLEGGTNSSANFQIGQTIVFMGDENLTALVDSKGVRFNMKKDLTGMNSIGFEGGATLTGTELRFSNLTKIGTNGLKVGSVLINPITNKISGISNPQEDSDAVNLGYLNQKLNDLPPGVFNINGNSGGYSEFTLGSTLTVIGNSDFESTDKGSNIATQISKDRILIGLKKTLSDLTSINLEDGTTLNNQGLSIDDNTKFSRGGAKLGNLELNPNGTILGISDPTLENHAVNKRFVDSEISRSIAELKIGGIKFIGNLGLTNIQLGESLTIKGTNDDFNSSDEGQNISTKTENGTVTIALSKNLHGLESVNAGSTNLNDLGLQIDKGPSFTKNGIDANGYKISNIAEANDQSHSNDAANVKYVKDKVENLKNLGYTFQGDSNKQENFAIGSIIAFTGDENITAKVSSNGVSVALNKTLHNMNGIAIKEGPTLNSEGLSFDGTTKITKDILKVGGVLVNSNGTISGLSDPKEKDHATNKGYVDGQIATVKNNLSTLQNSPIKFVTNENEVSKKLGETVSIKGHDSNNNGDKDEFDSANVMTWIDEQGILRIGVRKEINLSKIKAEDASSGQSSELTPNSLVFNGVDNKSGEDGKITLDVTTNGQADVTGQATPRLKINGVNIATLNDGMKYVANSGQPQNVKLNNTITVKGAEKNTDVTLFDGGENVMTTIEQDGKGVKYTVAFKKVPEFAGLTVGGMLANEKSPNIILKSLDGEEKFSATVDEEGAGIVTVTGNDSELKTDLMHDGLTINDVDGFSKLGTSTEGMGSLSTPDKTKRRLTHSYNIGSEEVVDEELATLNDGLKIEANIADGSGHASLNTKVKIVGSDKNRTWEEFDSGYNIMTKIEKTEDGETVIRVALRNDLDVKSGSFGGSGTDGFLNIKNEHGKEGITITPSEIRFNNTKKLLSKDHNQQDEVSMGITMTHSGSPNLLSGESVTRIQITDNSGTPTAEVATMNDGLRFKGDTEDVLEKPLSNTLTIIGGESDASKLTALEDKNIGVIAHNLSANDTKISSEKVLTVRMSRNLKGLHSAEFKTLDESGNASGKSIRIDDAGVTIAKGEKGVQLSEEGLTLGEKGPSITNNGINAGGMSISNVGIPTEAHHASSKGYVDRELANVQGQLGSKIQEARKDSLGGAAMAMATAGLPQAYKPGKSAFAVSGGVVAGQSAFAMGLSTISEDGKWIIKGSVSSDSRSQVGGSIGAAYQW